MNVTFKKFKYFPSLSEETSAFTADVYIDGVLFCFAENTGKGGCTSFSPVKDMNYPTLWGKIKDFETKCGDTLENHVDELVEANIQYKSLKRLMKTKKVFCENGYFYTGACSDITKSYILNNHTDAENIEFIWRTITFRNKE